MTAIEARDSLTEFLRGGPDFVSFKDQGLPSSLSEWLPHLVAVGVSFGEFVVLSHHKGVEDGEWIAVRKGTAIA